MNIIKRKYIPFLLLLIIVFTIPVGAFNKQSNNSLIHIIYSNKIDGIIWIDTVEVLKGKFNTKIAYDKVLMSLEIISSEAISNYTLHINNFRFMNDLLFINATLYLPPIKVLVSYAVNGNVTFNLESINNSWVLFKVILSDVRGYISRGISPNFEYSVSLKNSSSLYINEIPLYFNKLVLKYIVNLKTDESYYIAGKKSVYLGKFPLLPYNYLRSPSIYCEYLINQTIKQLKHIVSQKSYLENIINKVRSLSNKTQESELLENYTNNIILNSLPYGDYLGYKYRIEILSDNIKILGKQVVSNVTRITKLNRTYLKEIKSRLFDLLKANNTKAAERLLLHMVTTEPVDELNPDGIKYPIDLNLHWAYPIISHSTLFVLPMYLNTTHEITYLFFSSSPPPSEGYHNLEEYIRYQINELKDMYQTNNFTYKYFPENFTIYFYANNTMVFGTTFWPVDVNGTDYYRVIVHNDLYQRISNLNNLWNIYHSNVQVVINRIHNIVNDFFVSAVSHGLDHSELMDIINELYVLLDNLEEYFPEPQTSINITTPLNKLTNTNNSISRSNQEQIPIYPYLVYGLLAIAIAIVLLTLIRRLPKNRTSNS